MRFEGREQRRRSLLLKDNRVVHAVQSRHQLGPLILRQDRAPRVFGSSGGSVRVHPHYQDVAQGLCLLKVAEVTQVEQVKIAIGEDQSLARSSNLSGQW